MRLKDWRWWWSSWIKKNLIDGEVGLGLYSSFGGSVYANFFFFFFFFFTQNIEQENPNVDFAKR